ncbi:hypothetical protein FB45DRAFT_880550 [Roridomyces roridus]|uniref:Uncharacterized protein n=1 Tax=Roridomyces roridus TaxID=1738132 RepID=A0AAD7AYN3_9AGAR|nr:hypothetical protein FB45DRAFT_880550 [Roridomyces roridus]
MRRGMIAGEIKSDPDGVDVAREAACITPFVDEMVDSVIKSRVNLSKYVHHLNKQELVASIDTLYRLFPLRPDYMHDDGIARRNYPPFEEIPLDSGRVAMIRSCMQLGWPLKSLRKRQISVYGDLELFMMLQQSLQSSVFGGTRLVKLSNNSLLLALYLAGMWNSLLGVNDRTRKGNICFFCMSPKVGDVRLECMGKMQLKMTLGFENYNTYDLHDTNIRREYVFEQPHHWSSVFLDAPLTFTTLDDLINLAKGVIAIEPGMVNQPLLSQFLSSKPRRQRAHLRQTDHLRWYRWGCSAYGCSGWTGWRQCKRVVEKGDQLGEYFFSLIADIVENNTTDREAETSEFQLTTAALIDTPSSLPTLVAEPGGHLDSPDSAIIAAIFSEAPRTVLIARDAPTLLAPAIKGEDDFTLSGRRKIWLSDAEEKEIASDPRIIELHQQINSLIRVYKAFFKNYTGVGKSSSINTMEGYAQNAEFIKPSRAPLAEKYSRRYLSERKIVRRNKAAAKNPASSNEHQPEGDERQPEGNTSSLAIPSSEEDEEEQDDDEQDDEDDSDTPLPGFQIIAVSDTLECVVVPPMDPLCLGKSNVDVFRLVDIRIAYVLFLLEPVERWHSIKNAKEASNQTCSTYRVARSRA